MSSNRRRLAQAGRLAAAPTLKILVYGDDPAFADGAAYGTLKLAEALKNPELPGELKVEPRVLLRHEGHRLTPTLLAQFHEVWFFLMSDKGTELDDEERRALLEWMDRGNGVLIAGDHAVQGPAPDTYFGLGGAVGRSVPRARHLRRWHERPSRGPGDVADSTDSVRPGPRPQSYELHVDEVPQRLLLPTDDEALPHKIFRDDDGLPLDRFPDHAHEGEVKLTLDSTLSPIEGEWPDGLTPAPQLVARGINWRYGRTFDLMAVWDGHTAARACGRVVADASFHHYVDENLLKIAGNEDDAAGWRTISKIYRNIATWLAPPDIKRAYRELALAWAAEHERVADFRFAGYPVLGRAAASVLAGVLPAVWLRELVDDIAAERGLASLSSHVRAELGPYLLGASVRELRATRAKAVGLAALAEPLHRESIAAPEGVFAGALDDYAKALERKQQELGQLLAKIRPAGE